MNILGIAKVCHVSVSAYIIQCKNPKLLSCKTLHFNILCNWNAWFNWTCTSLPLSPSITRISKTHDSWSHWGAFYSLGSFITIENKQEAQAFNDSMNNLSELQISFSPFSYQFNLVGLREWELNFHGRLWEFIDHACVLLKWSINGMEIILMANISRSNKCLNFILGETWRNLKSLSSAT